MQQPASESASPLEYAKPVASPSNLAAWLVASSLGVTGGYLLSISGFGFLPFAMFMGAVTGTAAAVAAITKKVLFGVYGNGLTAVVGITIACVRNARAGIPNEYGLVIVAVPLAFAITAFPGLICGLLLTAASQQRQRKSTQ